VIRSRERSASLLLPHDHVFMFGCGSTPIVIGLTELLAFEIDDEAAPPEELRNPASFRSHVPDTFVYGPPSSDFASRGPHRPGTSKRNREPTMNASSSSGSDPPTSRTTRCAAKSAGRERGSEWDRRPA